jgi:hypothetical protein
VEWDETVLLTLSAGFLLTGSGQTSHLVTIQDGAVVTNEDTPINITLATGGLGNQPNYNVIQRPLHGTVNGTLPDLLYSPAADFNGNDSLLIQIYDGAVPTYQASIGLKINPVNDVPQFAIGTEIGATDESPAQTIANWATSVSPGPTDAMDEAGQSISFIVTNDNSGFFKVQPTVNAAGTLTFTPAPNVQGTALVNVVIEDNGGTAHGGVDHSLPQTFQIEIKKARIWHNAANELDVNGDTKIAPNDALDVINSINAFGGQKVPSSGSTSKPYWDVNGDGWVAPNDALDVINYINAFGADAEGATPSQQIVGAPSPSPANASKGNPLLSDDLMLLLAVDLASHSKRRV